MTEPNSDSLALLSKAQSDWASREGLGLERPGYVATLDDNLFLRHLTPETKREFEFGDGAELADAGKRPAKMRALLSSSALAVNVFDFWRTRSPAPLGASLGLERPVANLSFEYKCRRHPVGPRSPNLDLLLTLTDGTRVAVESKFCEPFRGKRGAALAPKYFPQGDGLWARRNLMGAQKLADRFRPDWLYLDVPQLLKHMLGLAHEPEGQPITLLYLWFDPGTHHSRDHAKEIERFAAAVAGDAVRFKAVTYQKCFATLGTRLEAEAMPYYEYLAKRYFASR